MNACHPHWWGIGNWKVPNVQHITKDIPNSFFALTLNHPYTILTQSRNSFKAKTACKHLRSILGWGQRKVTEPSALSKESKVCGGPVLQKVTCRSKCSGHRTSPPHSANFYTCKLNVSLTNHRRKAKSLPIHCIATWVQVLAEGSRQECTTQAREGAGSLLAQWQLSHRSAQVLNCYKVILLQWKELIVPVLWQNNTET